MMYLQQLLQKQTCSACKTDRASRTFVATDGNYPRFPEETNARAPAFLFADNDIKYDVNTLRAKAFAAAAENTDIMYCPAKDGPSPETLRARPDFPAQQIEWLKRHDHERGDL